MTLLAVFLKQIIPQLIFAICDFYDADLLQEVMPPLLQKAWYDQA